MRILHLSSALSWRGGENQILLLTKGLKELGVFNLICCPKGAPLLDRIPDQWATKITYNKKGGFSLSTSFLLKKLVHEEEIDVIHIHDAHAHNYAYTLSLLGLNTPIVVTRRVDFKLNRLSRYKYNHRNVKSICTVSNAIRSVLIRGGVHKHKITTIYSGIQDHNINTTETLHSTLGYGSPNKVVGFIGAMVSHKDPVSFVQVAKHLTAHDDDYRFVMIGAVGNETINVKKEIVKLDLMDKVTLFNFRPDLNSLWNSLDLLIVTSKEEGLGTIVLEAFTRGIPVVCTTAGGLSEIVHHGQNGFAQEHGHPKKMAHLAHLILTDNDLQKSIVNNAKIYVKDFHYSHMTQAYHDIYNRLITEG